MNVPVIPVRTVVSVSIIQLASSVTAQLVSVVVIRSSLYCKDAFVIMISLSMVFLYLNKGAVHLSLSVLQLLIQWMYKVCKRLSL